MGGVQAERGEHGEKAGEEVGEEQRQLPHRRRQRRRAGMSGCTLSAVDALYLLMVLTVLMGM
jgi:hypothetical protein